MARTAFPRVFWVGNLIEVLERFSYYGLYMGFGIYVTTSAVEGGLGWSKDSLGIVQTGFLFLSYGIPLISGVLADRHGFKRWLLISYLIYLPGFVLLVFARSHFAVIAVMALIATAAGVFKPLIAGTVRLSSDETNRTLGFGIFYLMVNVGAFLGPMVAGSLRTIHWNYAFLAAAAGVAAMFVVTTLFYSNPIEPDKDPAHRPKLLAHLLEVVPYALQPKILVFIVIFGLFIEIPFWSFFNIVTLFVDTHVHTDLLYNAFVGVLGTRIVDVVSFTDADGVRRIAGETIGHTALYIIIFQMLVTRSTEQLRSIPTVAIGILLMCLGCVGLFFSTGALPWLMFVGIFLFAIGEMSCMPRFEQYLISMLPPEKTGLGGGLLRIPVVIGALSGMTLTPAYGRFESEQMPEMIWLVMAGLLVLGFLLMLVYDRVWRDA